MNSFLNLPSDLPSQLTSRLIGKRDGNKLLNPRVGVLKNVNESIDENGRLARARVRGHGEMPMEIMGFFLRIGENRHEMNEVFFNIAARHRGSERFSAAGKVGHMQPTATILRMFGKKIKLRRA